LIGIGIGLGHEAFAVMLIYLSLATDGASFQWVEANALDDQVGIAIGSLEKMLLLEPDTHVQGISPHLSAEKLAKEQEQNLFLDRATKFRIEQTLEALGHDCGKIDGLFDIETRSAIRSFQNVWSFRETGYLDEVTFVRLLAIGIY